MTIDPFNPYPGPRHDPLPGDERHERIRRMQAQNDSGKAYVWVPAAIIGGVAAIVVLASL
jgi:hypothetical protein